MSQHAEVDIIIILTHCRTIVTIRMDCVCEIGNLVEMKSDIFEKSLGLQPTGVLDLSERGDGKRMFWNALEG